MTAFFKSCIALRNQNRALSHGDIETVYGEGPVSAYLRTADNKRMLIIGNTAETHDWYAALELGKYGVKTLKSINSDEMHTSETGRFNVHLPPCSYKIMEV